MITSWLVVDRMSTSTPLLLCWALRGKTRTNLVGTDNSAAGAALATTISHDVVWPQLWTIRPVQSRQHHDG